MSSGQVVCTSQGRKHVLLRVAMLRTQACASRLIGLTRGEGSGTRGEGSGGGYHHQYCMRKPRMFLLPLYTTVEVWNVRRRCCKPKNDSPMIGWPPGYFGRCNNDNKCSSATVTKSRFRKGAGVDVCDECHNAFFFRVRSVPQSKPRRPVSTAAVVYSMRDYESPAKTVLFRALKLCQESVVSNICPDRCSVPQQKEFYCIRGSCIILHTSY